MLSFKKFCYKKIINSIIRMTSLYILLGVLLLSNTIFSFDQLNIKSLKHVTVSGLSSGAYFAVQFHVAFSDIVNGCAVFAGGPYFCAKESSIIAQSNCMQTSITGPNVLELVELTREWSLFRTISNTNYLLNSTVYLFSGTKDTVVESKVVNSLEKYYEYFVKSEHIYTSYNVDAEHCMPTINYGNDCKLLNSPYIGQCNFDGAGKALNTLYGFGLNKPVAYKPENLLEFNQIPFIPYKNASIGEKGYIYVPTNCLDESVKCQLHISFHGCLQNIELIGNTYAVHSGYNEWAESNNIIILYR